MNEENTPRSNTGQEIPPEKSLDGIPMNLLCRASAIREFMGVSNETWSIWVEVAEQLNLKIDCHLGTKEGWSLTNDMHELFRRSPELPVRRSAIRKKQLEERKRKK